MIKKVCIALILVLCLFVLFNISNNTEHYEDVNNGTVYLEKVPDSYNPHVSSNYMTTNDMLKYVDGVSHNQGINYDMLVDHINQNCEKREIESNENSDGTVKPNQHDEELECKGDECHHSHIHSHKKSNTVTTMAPTTMAPTTMAPTTMAPTTMAPTTMAPTTMDPTTNVECLDDRRCLYKEETLDNIGLQPLSKSDYSKCCDKDIQGLCEADKAFCYNHNYVKDLNEKCDEFKGGNESKFCPTFSKEECDDLKEECDENKDYLYNMGCDEFNTCVMAPTTMAPTTMAPTTMAPTTMAPTTIPNVNNWDKNGNSINKSFFTKNEYSFINNNSSTTNVYLGDNIIFNRFGNSQAQNNINIFNHVFNQKGLYNIRIIWMDIIPGTGGYKGIYELSNGKNLHVFVLKKNIYIRFINCRTYNCNGQKNNLLNDINRKGKYKQQDINIYNEKYDEVYGDYNIIDFKVNFKPNPKDAD